MRPCGKLLIIQAIIPDTKFTHLRFSLNNIEHQSGDVPRFPFMLVREISNRGSYWYAIPK